MRVVWLLSALFSLAIFLENEPGTSGHGENVPPPTILAKPAPLRLDIVLDPLHLYASTLPVRGHASY